MKGPCILIANPTSGSFSQSVLRQVEGALRKGRLEVRVELTGSAEDAPRIAAQACNRYDRPLLVAMGGDGTFAGVLNGVSPGRAILGFIPSGTANVLGCELGIGSPLEGVARVVRGETRPMTAGVVEQAGMSRRFFLMAGIGLDGAIVKGARPAEKRSLKRGAYLLSALRRLAEWDRGMVVVETETARVECHTAIACNASRYGGDFVIDPKSSLSSPGLRLLCLPSASPLSYLLLAARIIAGKGTGPGIAVLETDAAVIHGIKPVQVDGDYLCESPVSLRAIPEFADLIV